MIIFDLSCPQGHAFEGWFQSPSAYEAQLSAGLISCPHCGASEIKRIPSAVHLAKPVDVPRAAKPTPSISTQDGMLAAYQQLMKLIVSSSEDVGKEFANEARKIHYQEAPERSIRGEASIDEYESLCDEGIDVLRLPVAKKERPLN